jgi:hypothetical protein
MGIFGILLFAGIGVYVYRTYFITNTYETKDERYNAKRNRRQQELDQLLDKISNQGVESLTNNERRRLDELSGRK